MDQRPAPQPGEQVVAVRRRQHGLQAVALLHLGHPGGAGQEVEIMIAQHGDDPVVPLPRPAQHLERVRTAVDQVAHEPETVLPGIVGDRRNRR